MNGNELIIENAKLTICALLHYSSMMSGEVGIRRRLSQDAPWT